MQIVWTLLGEKNLVGGIAIFSSPGALEISGAYYLEDDALTGDINIKQTGKFKNDKNQ